jgi:CDP-diacylglycerol---glycerol-3-phosphate 3-phosphatidyltransferase
MMTNRSLLTLSNTLSFIRAPLAFLFLWPQPNLRIFAILLAMITDSVDGYLARRSQSTSRFGAILDPAMDKFFVYFALAIFYLEGRITPFETAAMLSRDVFVLLYGLFCVALGRWRTLEFRAIRWGKATTALQFLVLMGLTFDFSMSWVLSAAFVVMGILAFFELLQNNEPIRNVG